MRHAYLLLCVVGLFVPYFVLGRFYLTHGPDLALLFQQPFSTWGAAFFSADLLITALAGLVFVIVEGRRVGVRPWLPIVAGLAVGVSLALPLFLYLRQRKLDRLEETHPA